MSLLRKHFVGSNLFILLVLALHSLSAFGQGVPSLYPVAWTTYGILEGLPDPCVESAYVTREGRLVLIGCNYVRQAHGLDVYLFDGKRAYPSALSQKKESQGMYSNFEGVDEAERCYGYYYPNVRQKADSLSYFFLYDPIKDTAQFIPFGKGQVHERLVHTVSAFEGEFFILTCGLYSDEFELLSLKGNDLRSLFTFKYYKKITYRHQSWHLEVTKSDFWIADSMHVLTRVSRIDGKTLTYPLPQPATPVSQNLVTEMKVTPAGDVLVYGADQKKLYRWDSRTSTIVTDFYLPSGWTMDDINDVMLTKDIQGNLLIVHQKQNGQTAGVLHDIENRYYDYSKVLEVTPVQRNLFMGGSRWSSRDFKKGIFITGTLFQSIEVAAQSEIQVIKTAKGTRGIIQLSQDALSVYPFGIYSLEDKRWYHNAGEELCFQPGGEPDAVTDNRGNVWTTDRNALCMYNIQSQECVRYENPFVILRFTFYEEDKIVLITEDNMLREFDVINHTFSDPVVTQRLPGYINQVYVGRDGAIWIATSQGLVHIDKALRYRLVDAQHGLHTSRIIRIHEDQAGKLWLGTFMDGLHIYDPVTQQVTVIDESNGLSNNTVVSILEDAEHFIWVGTFNGITVVSPDARILGHLYEQDGLVANECNRWSQSILQDGRLCFGSVFGVSILSPQAIRAQMKHHDTPKIYLTRLVHGGTVDDMSGIVSDTTNTIANTIVLSASNRNLQLGFALSNYSAPGKNTFAYRIAGVDNDWHYLGAQNEVTLSRLPAGNYHIEVIGADHRGQWTPTPVTIPIDAKEFFYLRWWFYVLCALPFLTIGIIWQYRQRQENKRLEREVKKRTETIQRQSDELREMDRMKSQLYTNITHEFRTPLTVIDGMVSHLSTDPHAPEIIKRNTRSLLNLVNQMLDLRKLEAGALPLHLVQTDIIRFVRYITESFRSLAAANQIRFHFLSNIASLVMDIDLEKLRQILANLLSNAIKFTPNGGDVYMQVDQAENQVVIKISDTGIGIPEDKIQHIFKRFYQVDNSSTKTGQGTGIGLTLTSELVHLMKGDISVASQLGHGTTFTVKLPIRHEAPLLASPDFDPHALDPFIAGLPITQYPETQDIIAGEEREKVLIVEDNPDVVHYLITCLKDQYHVLIANNGQDGIAQAIEHIPDAIVCDVMMPLKDGFEVCETLKNETSTSHIPIILLTAKADVASRIAGLRRGADAYLPKPFNEEELLVNLEALIAVRKKLQQRYQAIDRLAPTEDILLQTEDVFVKRFREVIESNIDDEDLDIPQLCQALNLSRAQLHRKITVLTGKSASTFVRSIRLHAAKKYLSDPEMNIAQVAYAVGFRYPENFSRAFSEEFGLSPSQWREKNSDKFAARKP